MTISNRWRIASFSLHPQLGSCYFSFRCQISKLQMDLQG